MIFAAFPIYIPVRPVYPPYTHRNEGVVSA